MDKIQLGKIVNAVGLKGEVKVYPYTDEKEYFETIDSLMVKPVNGKECRFFIERVRYQKEMTILKLKGIDDRTTAETWKNAVLYLERSEAPSLPDGTYYVRDLMGMAVIDEENKRIGCLKSVIKNSSQDLYEIEKADGSGTFLLPAVKEFVKKIDLSGKTITVHLIDGIMNLDT